MARQPHNKYEFLRREAAVKTRLDLTAFSVTFGHMEFYLIGSGSGNHERGTDGLIADRGVTGCCR